MQKKEKALFFKVHPISIISIKASRIISRVSTFWACSLGGILEEFGWFGRMLEEFEREKHYSK